MFRVLLAALCLSIFALQAQPISRDPNVRTAEAYLRKVLAANGASAPVPSPNAAEKAALEALRARVNDKDELEIPNWPNSPLNQLKTVGQMNGLVGQLSNTGIYKAKAEQNARDAARNEQIAAVRTRSETLQETGSLAKAVRITATQNQQSLMRRYGYVLNEENAIEVGGKTFELGEAKAEELVDLSEPGKKKFASYYSKGAEAVDKKLADPKLGFVERQKLEEAKKERDAMIAATNELLSDFRQKQIALDRASATPAPPAPTKKK